MNKLQEQGAEEEKSISFPTPNPQSTIHNSNSNYEMREPTTDSAVAYAIALLSHYKFELKGYTAQELVNRWLRKYPANWVRLGVIEALYQGRYKAVSVEQFLTVWGRRGQPSYRFNREFERLISRKLPQNLTAPLDVVATDLLEEYSLLPLAPSTEDEAILDEPALPSKQDSPPTITTALEDVTGLPLQRDNQLSGTLSNTTASHGYAVDWSRCELKKQPIHQFTPPPDSSNFFLKLKAVVQQQDSTSNTVRTPLVDELELTEPDVDQV